ncbi:MAG: amidohydrolase [bacterium]
MTKLYQIRRSLFLLGILLFSSLSAASPHLIYNVSGYTLSKGHWQRFDSLLFDQGVVLETGQFGQLKSKAEAWNRIDGQGAMLIPGLTDAHGHLLGLGLNVSRLDLRDAQSLEQALNSIDAYVKSHSSQRWIQGRGWNQVFWEDNQKQFPNKNQLDEVISERPVWLRRIDGHAGWANSKALQIAGISKSSIDPEGGKIVRNKAGEPTGVLIDNAMSMMEEKIPSINDKERQAALKAAFAHMLELGLTSMHDAGTDYETMHMLLGMSARGQIPVRINAMISGDDKKLDEMLKMGKVHEPYLEVNSVKLYADGALGSRGAWLLEPYQDQPEQSGLVLTDPAKLKTMFVHLAAKGYQVNVHAIGDKANREVLNIIEGLPEASTAHHLRHRIEHAQIVNVDDIPRFAQLGVIASMQPTHATSDKNMAPDRLGEKRLAGAYAWRKMLDHHVKLAFGSDFPVELANPMLGIYASVTRMDLKGEPKGGWLPGEKLSMAETLQAFTLGAAYAGFLEDQLGSLEPGKKADFVLLDQDLFEIEQSRIPATKVLQTWVDGQLRYQKP